MKKIVTGIAILASQAGYALAQTINIGVGASQGQVNGNAILGLLNLAQTIVARLVPFAVGLAVVVFFWFLIKFVINSNEPEAKNANLKGMGYSILALFVMVSIWGIIGFLGSVFGINQGGNVPIPGVPIPQ
jgi:hypothetical protein